MTTHKQILVACCWLVSACHDLRVETPPDFVAVEDSSAYRGMDPHAVVLAVPPTPSGANSWKRH